MIRSCAACEKHCAQHFISRARWCCNSSWRFHFDCASNESKPYSWCYLTIFQTPRHSSLQNQVWNGKHAKTDNWKCIHVKNSSLHTGCLDIPDLAIQCSLWKTRQFHCGCSYSQWIIIPPRAFVKTGIYTINISNVLQFVTVRSRLFSSEACGEISTGYF